MFGCSKISRPTLKVRTLSFSVLLGDFFYFLLLFYLKSVRFCCWNKTIDAVFYFGSFREALVADSSGTPEPKSPQTWLWPAGHDPPTEQVPWWEAAGKDVMAGQSLHFISFGQIPDGSAGGLVQNASPKTWDSPGLPGSAPLRIPQPSPAAESEVWGWGRWRNEEREEDFRCGWAPGEMVMGGGNRRRIDVSSSSCLRSSLFSVVTVFNWTRKRKTSWH